MAVRHPLRLPDLERLPDRELVECARRSRHDGERGLETASRCVAVIVERYRDLIHAVCGAKSPRAVAEDIVGDAHARILRTVVDGQRPVENLPALLTVICKNARASWLDAQSRKPQTTEWPEADPPDAAVYDDALAVTVIVDALRPLTPRQREVFFRRALADQPSDEVAAALGTTPGNVDVILHRVREALQGRGVP